MTWSTERMAARQTPGRQPASAPDAVKRDGICGVVGARRKEPARPAEVRRHDDLVRPDQRERDPNTEVIAAGANVARGCGGNRLQEQSGWRRAALASARPRRRIRMRFCFDGKPLVSVVWLYFAEPRRPASAWRRCPNAPGRANSPGQRVSHSGHVSGRRARTRARSRLAGGSVRSA